MHAAVVSRFPPRLEIGLGLSSRRVATIAGAGLLILNVLNAIALVQRPWRDADPEASGWLLMAYEGNPATWFTSLAMFAAAGACLLVALTEAEGSTARRRWRQLALVPVLLSIDEVCELHERMGNALDLGGPLHYSWVIPGALIIAVLAALFAKFVWQQGPFVRNLLVVAGGTVVGGGILVEAFNGELDGRASSWIYMVSTTIEENLELLGVLLVVVGLVEVAARRGLRLAFSRP